MHWLVKMMIVVVALAALAVTVSFVARARASARGGGPERPMARCPKTPNCVSSDASDERQRVAPLPAGGDPAAAWEAATAAVAALPRTTVVESTDRYLHATCRSAVFGFVDDLELELRPQEGTIAVRSASRQGYSDLGVNRRRVERLHEMSSGAAR